MLKGREIRLSARDRLVDMFGAPPSGSGLSVFTVYNESQFRDTTFTPNANAPYIFILDADVMPVDTRLPLIVIENAWRKRRSFEIGNRNGRFVRMFFNVFGKNRAERDDLADFIGDYFGNTITIKSYSEADPTGTAVETAVIEDEIVVEAMNISGPVQGRQEIEFGGDLINWARIRLEFQCKL